MKENEEMQSEWQVHLKYFSFFCSTEERKPDLEHARVSIRLYDIIYA